MLLMTSHSLLTFQHRLLLIRAYGDYLKNQRVTEVLKEINNEQQSLGPYPSREDQPDSINEGEVVWFVYVGWLQNW